MQGQADGLKVVGSAVGSAGRTIGKMHGITPSSINGINIPDSSFSLLERSYNLLIAVSDVGSCRECELASS